MLPRCVLATALFSIALSSIAQAATPPAEWVPARWPYSTAASLELLQGAPVNCLLLREYPADFVAAANGKGLVTLAVLKPGSDPRPALAAKVMGLVLEGDFPDAETAAIRAAAGGLPV